VPPGSDRGLSEATWVALLTLPAAISVPVYFILGNVTWIFAVIWGFATLASVLLVYAVRRSGDDWRREWKLLFYLALALGIISIVTGFGNNATDEPFTMNAYLGLLLSGQDPYVTWVNVTFTAHVLNIWSNTVSAPYTYVYLPLGLFLQVPGTGAIGYRSLCLACWVGIVYLVRKHEFAVICMVSPTVVLVAANGFTDLPALLLCTFALFGPGGWIGTASEYCSYGTKQFAVAFWFVYHLLRKQWLKAGLVILITLAWVAPFLVWHPYGVWCEALTLGEGPGCQNALSSTRHISDLWSHWNYYLWILWVYALFHTTINRWILRAWSTFRGPGRSPSNPKVPTPMPLAGGADVRDDATAPVH